MGVESDNQVARKRFPVSGSLQTNATTTLETAGGAAGGHYIVLHPRFPISRGEQGPFQYRTDLKTKPFRATREYINLCKTLANGLYA
jgi:hypothetical protein